MTDSELLQSFAATHSADAFSELATRHAPAVYAAARRQLPDPSEADDITQAVFLVLARRAPHLPSGVILSSWLLKTTYLACCQARRTVARRRKHEQRAAAMRPTSAPAMELSELAPILDAALARLSDSDRSAILLRYLEQKSVDEVSQSLGVSSETAQKRISRAVARLRKLLGVGEPAVSASSLAAFFTVHGQCAVPQALLDQITTLPGAATAAGISTTVATLSKGVLKTMLWLKLKLIGAASLATLIIGTAGTLIAQQTLAPTQSPVATAPPVPPAAAVLNVKVELLGLTTQTDAGLGAWWSANGAPLPQAPDIKGPVSLRLSHSADQRVVVFAVRLSYPPGTDVSCDADVAGLQGSASDGDPKSRILLLGAVVPASQSSTALRTNLATGTWTTAISTSGGHAEAAGQTAQGDFTVSRTFQDDQSLSVVFADNSLVTADRRFVALDAVGQEHQHNGLQASATRGVVLRTVTFRDLRQEQVRDIRYDMRPYTDFIEFSNISIKPGTITKPQVQTGKINPGIIAADNPGDIGEYYVGGSMARVGVYSLTARQITLKQAVVSAGMPSGPLEEMQVDLVRRLPGNQERITTMDLGPIFKGTQPDRYLQPNDLLQVHPKTPATAPADPR